MPLRMIREFLRLEAAAGVVLALAALIGLLLANSPAAALYGALLDTPVAVRIGGFEIAKPLLLWINDGLMAVFFLLVGLEIKREVLEGELSTRAKVLLPAFAAVGGMVVPAAVYLAVQGGDPATSVGWAIPTATDIAFALGVLALLGDRVPTSLKIFLLALAIIDDLGAIVIIALFYTADLSPAALGLAAAALVALVALNRAGVTRTGPYVVVGVFLWVCVLKSGVHATLAGVALGLAVPLREAEPRGEPALVRLEHALHPWVAFGILPLFGFANAGVSLAGLSLADLTAPVPLGIAAGLFLGKQAGVMAFSWLAVRLGRGRLPEGATPLQLYGVAVLTGVGFTMSLFIGTLAFPTPAYAEPVRIGVLAGSLLSAVVGYAVLRLAPLAAPARAGVRRDALEPSEET